MPKIEEDSKTITKWINEKQQNEVDLSKAILKIFDTTPELINPLREMARHALEEIDSLNNIAKDTSILLYKSIIDALADEKRANMTLLKEGFLKENKFVAELPDQLRAVAAKWQTFDATLCSDVIRLYGTVSEKANGVPNGEITLYGETRKQAVIAGKAFAKSEVGVQFKAWAEQIKLAMKDPKAAFAADSKTADLWEKYKDDPKVVHFVEEFKKEKNKLRVGGSGGKGDNVWDKPDMFGKLLFDNGRYRFNKEDKTEAPLYQAAIDAAGMSEVQEALVGLKGGQALFALADKSTIGKIDRMFGLVPAADISGTTADTMGFLQRFFTTYSQALDPIYYMLPMGTIVANGHHSMVEVALPLSQGKKVQYTIGLYSSLMPVGKSKNAGAGALLKALQTAEKDARNRLMLIGYDTTKKPYAPAVAYVYEASDSVYKGFADGVKALAWFGKHKAAVDGWDSKMELQKMVQGGTLGK